MRAALLVLLCASPVLASPGQQIQEALIRGDAKALSVEWTLGRPEEDRRRLWIEDGSARLASCPAGAPACSEVGARAPLTTGQRERLLSGLRALDLGTLRSAGPEGGVPDRALTVTLAPGKRVSVRLNRSDWPVPPSGDSAGLAAFLDEVAGTLGRAAVARRPLPVPRTSTELSAVQLKLKLRPKEKPGGTLILERGLARVVPEEGTVPRTPAPGPFARRLSEAELERLAQALAAAELDRLDEVVPRRAAPAVGDSDGRLLTLHLLPLLDEAQALEAQPRGWERFLLDLQRAPTAALVEQLLSILLAPAEQTGPPPRTAREVVGRDDLVLSWRGPGTQIKVHMADLAPAPREELRRALVVAGPYLDGRPKGGERVLSLTAPIGKGREHLVGSYGAALASWRRGPTEHLAGLLEAQLQGPSKKP